MENEEEEIELEVSDANDDDADEDEDEDDDRRVKTLGALEKYGRGGVEKGWKEGGWRVATFTPVHCANNASYRLHNERGYSYPSGKERGTRSEEKTAGSLVLLLAASGRREPNRLEIDERARAFALDCKENDDRRSNKKTFGRLRGQVQVCTIQWARETGEKEIPEYQSFRIS
ncbi:hypothetical protein HZH68_013871 [Vespula germanica]|uniref:Uncharacterized protein n=1 Tax=Vespula germanica TaxID=30212 RepID=A0A834JH88_VESGE|nr:hypothetical protein HZH68_013871 [Vespula germanica]